MEKSRADPRMRGRWVPWRSWRWSRLEARSWTEVAELVQRAQEGDREAFGRLVEQFQPTVHAIALRRLGNASEAMELTQEVFLHVLRRITSFVSPSGSPAGCGRWRCGWRSTGRRGRVAPSTVETGVLEGAYEHADEPVDELISRERAERLWAALGRLKTLDREAWSPSISAACRWWRSPSELDVPLGTIKRRLHTARKRLRLELEASVADAEEWTDGLVPGADTDLDEEESGCVGAGLEASPW